MSNNERFIMQEHIENAKRAAEERYLQKREKQGRLSMTIDEILADEDIQELCRLNDLFDGKVVNFTKTRRFKSLNQIAEWMDANWQMVNDYSVSPISSDKPNASVSIDIQKLIYIKEDELRAFIAACSLSDTITISSMNKDFTRITFGLLGVYSETIKVEVE